MKKSSFGISSPSSLTRERLEMILLIDDDRYIDTIKVAASNGYDTLLYQPITIDSML